MTGTDLALSQASGEIPLARRLNLWLGKFSSPHTRKAYADDLGIPHEARAWYAASPLDAPARRGRRRGELRRGLAFFPWCHRNGLDPLQVPLEQLQQWVGELEAAGIAKRTRARMITSVSEFYIAMQRQDLKIPNPAALLDRRAAQLTGNTDDDDQVYLEVPQVRQLLILARRGSGRGRDLYRERDLAVLEILAVTGSRAGAVCALDLADYRRPDPAGPASLVLRGKGGKVRTATIDAQVADDIDAWLTRRATLLGTHLPAPAGTTPAGRQPLLCTRTGARIPASYLGTIIKKVARLPGSPLRGIAAELHPHVLRAAFVTAALDAGVPIEQVAAAVGHSHIATTQRYDRRRKRRATKAFTVVSSLYTDDEATTEEAAGALDLADPATSASITTTLTGQ